MSRRPKVSNVRSTLGPRQTGLSIIDRPTCLVVRLATVAFTRTHAGQEPTVHDRLLDTAYEMFSTRGVRDVGVDEVIDRAGVAKATLYRHFPSKDDLVLAFLERREKRWTLEWVETEARGRGSSPEAHLLGIFDLFDEWFHSEDFEGCSFINVLLEMGPKHPAGSASIRHLETIRTVVGGLAAEAGLRDPDSFARSCHILMKGAIVQAVEGDVEAAQRSKVMARFLLDKYRGVGSSSSSVGPHQSTPRDSRPIAGGEQQSTPRRSTRRNTTSRAKR
jgi:AcrR family transcriptional regulator